MLSFLKFLIKKIYSSTYTGDEATGKKIPVNRLSEQFNTFAVRDNNPRETNGT
jgi:nicotinamide riboside kinase